MKFFRGSIYYYILVFLCCIIVSIIFLCAIINKASPILPFVIITIIFWTFCIILGVSPLGATFIIINDHGIKCKYFKKNIQFSWKELKNCQELGGGPIPLMISIETTKQNKYSIIFNYNRKKINYMIEKCTNEDFKLKLIELSKKNFK